MGLVVRVDVQVSLVGRVAVLGGQVDDVSPYDHDVVQHTGVSVQRRAHLFVQACGKRQFMTLSFWGGGGGGGGGVRARACVCACVCLRAYVHVWVGVVCVCGGVGGRGRGVGSSNLIFSAKGGWMGAMGPKGNQRRVGGSYGWVGSGPGWVGLPSPTPSPWVPKASKDEISPPRI